MSLLTNVIPTYNRWSALRTHLQLLELQTLGADSFEVIVVSDGSSDGTREMVEGFESSYALRYLEIPDEGYRVGKCRNIGIREARGDCIVLTDDDLLPLSDYLERFSRLVRSGRAIVGYGDFFQHPNGAFTSLAAYAVGPSTGVWRDDVIAAGMYDEDMPYYGLEDFDLGFRMWKSGIEFEYHPEIYAHNYGMGYNLFNKKRANQRAVELQIAYDYLYEKYKSMKLLDESVTSLNDISIPQGPGWGQQYII